MHCITSFVQLLCVISSFMRLDASFRSSFWSCQITISILWCVALSKHVYDIPRWRRVAHGFFAIGVGRWAWSRLLRKVTNEGYGGYPQVRFLCFGILCARTHKRTSFVSCKRILRLSDTLWRAMASVQCNRHRSQDVVELTSEVHMCTQVYLFFLLPSFTVASFNFYASAY